MKRTTHFFLALCVALAATAPLCAQTQPKQLTQADWAKVHELAMAAMNELFNLRFAESEARCGEAMALAPRDPRGHFFRAMIYYYRNVIYREKADFEKFLALSQRGIQVCEAILKDNERDSKAMFYLGGLYGYRGMIYANNNELMKAVWDGKKGYDKLKEAVEIDPSNADAQMGLGLFNYMISQAPAFVKPALRLAGLSGDRLAGLKQLDNAARNGLYTKAEAQYLLANILRNDLEQQYENAASLLQNLIAKYPNNDFFQMTYAGLMLFNLRKPDKAIPLYKQIVAKGAQGNKIAVGRAMLNLGTAHLYKGKFAEALQWYGQCAAFAADTAQVRDANFNAGWCWELQGNHTAAAPYFQRSPGAQRSADLLKTPLAPHDIAVEKQSLFFSGGMYDEAFAAGEEILTSKNLSDEIKARALYVQARALFEKGDYSKSEERFSLSSALHVAKATWLPPNSRYRLALAQLKLGKKSEAKSSLEAALSYKDYQNEDFIKRLIQKELSRLKNI